MMSAETQCQCKLVFMQKGVNESVEVTMIDDFVACLTIIWNTADPFLSDLQLFLK